jgi:hypothetical protein
VVATSLGNFLFDQQVAPQSTGMILETLVGRDGVTAWRRGRTRGDDLRVHFEEWLVPGGDAALVDGDWWSAAAMPITRSRAETLLEFAYGDVVAATVGDVAGDGGLRVLVSYRHPQREVPADPRPQAVDAEGRTAHIGVFEVDGTPVWMSHRPPHAVGDLVVCDGAAMFAYTDITDPAAVVAIGAGVWNGFGFTLAPELEGDGTIGCTDIDGDGRLEPIVANR